MAARTKKKVVDPVWHEKYRQTILTLIAAGTLLGMVYAFWIWAGGSVLINDKTLKETVATSEGKLTKTVEEKFVTVATQIGEVSKQVGKVSKNQSEDRILVLQNQLQWIGTQLQSNQSSISSIDQQMASKKGDMVFLTNRRDELMRYRRVLERQETEAAATLQRAKDTER